jgi:hypothetical protein
MTERIPFDEWAQDEDAQFGGNWFDDVNEVSEFVLELLDLDVKSVEIGLHNGKSIGDMYLEVPDKVSKNLVAAIVKTRPDDCRIESDGTIWIWWD